MPVPSLSVSIPHRPPAAHGRADDSHSRSSSVNSHSPSIQSAANSTRYMLAGMNSNSSGLDPPSLPYGSRAGSYRSMSPKNDTPLMSAGADGKATSLSVNYLPSKFSANILSGGIKRRKGKGGDIPLPKTGGGREAFRANESRMPGDGDDDYDGVSFGQNARKGRLRWNRFKWVLFISNLVVSLSRHRYSLTRSTLAFRSMIAFALHFTPVGFADFAVSSQGRTKISLETPACPMSWRSWAPLRSVLGCGAGSIRGAVKTARIHVTARSSALRKTPKSCRVDGSHNIHVVVCQRLNISSSTSRT